MQLFGKLEFGGNSRCHQDPIFDSCDGSKYRMVIVDQDFKREIVMKWSMPLVNCSLMEI